MSQVITWKRPVDLGPRFGVGEAAIRKIRNRERWKHV